MKAPEAPAVRSPIMIHEWRAVTFLHWRYPLDVVQSLLPDGLIVQTRDQSAWVGLVPLLMEVRAPSLPPIPWLSRFPETNVRTYVHGPDGRPGIWFFSLDAARLPVVAGARAGYGLPYRWARMSVRRGEDQVSYRSRRRRPGLRGARCDARVELGASLEPDQAQPLDHFLTARYRLYSVFAGRLVVAEVHHEPWPLRRANLVDLDQSVIEAAGLPAVSGDPLVHASDGVTVRVGMWRPV